MRERLAPVLDVGCGEGRLIGMLKARGVMAFGIDRSSQMLEAVKDSAMLGDAEWLPFKDETFGAVAALYMLYHLPDPRTAIREAHRVLRARGLFVAATPSRQTDPEFAEFQRQQATTFDAEDAPELVRSVFQTIEVERWDGPFITLPTRAAVAEYLLGRGTRRTEIEAIVRRVDVPLSVTKRGCIVWGYKEGEAE